MNVFIYNGAMYCESCADKIKNEMPEHEHPGIWCSDSMRYPQEVPDGGGEADSPQHCDHCNVFLENPLTDQGMSYVRGKVDVLTLLEGTNPVVKVWADFYGVTL